MAKKNRDDEWPEVPMIELIDSDDDVDEEEVERLALDEHVESRTRNMRIEMLARERHEQELADEAFKRFDWPAKETAAELIESDHEDHWYIDGILPTDGKSLLAAQAKAGKTTMVANLAHALVTRRPFLGVFPVNAAYPLNVLVIDNEMSPGLLKKWYARMKMNKAAKKRLGFYRLLGQRSVFNPLSPQSRRFWVEVLSEQDVVIIDCLAPFLAAAGLEENSGADVQKWLDALDSLMAEAGVKSYVLVHHTGHDGTRARGASALLGWGTQNITLNLEKNGPFDPHPRRIFNALDGRGEPVEPGMLSFNSDTGMLGYHPELVGAGGREKMDTEERRWMEVASKIEEILGFDAWFTMPDCEEATGLKRGVLTKALNYGEDISRVKKRKDPADINNRRYQFKIMPKITLIDSDNPDDEEE